MGRTEEYLVVRDLDRPVPPVDLEEAADRCRAVAEDLREEGADIEWLESEVLLNDEGWVTGTVCTYRAESERTIREHAERARMPVTRIARRGRRLDGER